MADIKDRIATIQARHGWVSAEAFASRCSVRGGSAAVPSRTIIDAVTPCVIYVEEYSMAHLTLKGRLQSVVIGTY